MPPASEELRKSKQFKFAVQQVEEAIDLEQQENANCPAAYMMDEWLTSASDALALGNAALAETQIMKAMSTASGANRHLDAGKKAGKSKKQTIFSLP